MKNINLSQLHKMYCAGALVGLLSLGSVWAAEIPTTRGMVPLLGQGYLPERQDLAGECLTGTPVLEGKPESSVQFSSSIGEDQLASELGFSAGGKARFGLTQVGASASFYNSSRSDGFSISVIYSGTYAFKNRIFKTPDPKPQFKIYADNLNANKWKEACGDEFVSQQLLGAKLFFSIRIDFLNQKEQESFASSFNFSAPMASASAELSKTMSHLSKRTKVSVNVLQIGGKVDQVTKIFNARPGSEGSTGPTNAFRFVQCSSGQFEECKNVLAQAVEYATNAETGFPSQISPDLTDLNKDGGPAVLSSLTSSYKTANVFLDTTLELENQMRTARQAIAAKYEVMYNQYMRAKRLARNGVVRLSPKQRERFVSMESKLFLGLERISESSLRCYQYPKQCGDAYASLDETIDGGVKPYPDTAFNVDPELFVQYCDLGMSPLSQDALTRTVGGMVKQARKLSPDAFIPPYKDAPVDECNAAENVLSRLTELNLDGLGISDFRPVSALKNLVSLSLADNGLQSLEGIESLSQLQVLKLARNRISDVGPIADLKKLKTLDLSDNSIKSTEGLATLAALGRLDLRNNERGIQCPFLDASRCLIADFRYNNSFVHLKKGTVAPRKNHSAAVLPNGNVLITGGLSDELSTAAQAEIFDPIEGRFRWAARLKVARQSHSSITLLNGNVFVHGGFGVAASRSAEIYDALSDSFTMTREAPRVPRASHSLSLLKDGRVLIVGGWSNETGLFTGMDATSTVEIYDPVKQTFQRTASLRLPRASHRATVLSDGRVLVTGGYTPRGSLTSVEIFDPIREEWTLVRGRMQVGRSAHSAVLLRDGRVFIAGGFDANQASGSVEIFDPQTGFFDPIADSMTVPRGDHETLLLSDGKIVIFGGRDRISPMSGENASEEQNYDTAEIYDPVSNLFTQLSKKMEFKRVAFTVTPVGSDKFLILGGQDPASAYSAELFDYMP